VIGGRVLTDQGLELAAIADVELDPATGHLVDLLLADGTTIEAAALLGIGRYATVIRHQE
jgi:sporulation protein YlmC with PRC-barrel domain